MPNWQEPFHIPLKKRNGIQQEPTVTALSKNQPARNQADPNGPKQAANGGD